MSAHFWRQPESGADSDDDNDDDDSGWNTVGSSGGRGGTIYMIDAAISASFEHLDTSLAIIERSMMNGLVQSTTNLVGVCVYNTVHSPEPGANATSGAAVDGVFGSAVAFSAPPAAAHSLAHNDTAKTTTSLSRHIVPPATAIVWPMQVHSRAAVQFFKNWRCSDDQHDFAGRFGCHADGRHLSEALWLCSRMLTGCDYKLQNAGIVLFTNNADPLSDCDAGEELRVLERARDLRALNVKLTVVPLIDHFDGALFYRQLICAAEDADVETFRMPPPAEQREFLCMPLFQRDYRFACMRYLSLHLGGNSDAEEEAAGPEIGCAMYALTRKTLGPQTVHMVASSNEVVQSRLAYVRAERLEGADEEVIERVLQPGELSKYIEVGGQRITFSAEEICQIRGIMDPGLRLLGFKPLAELPTRSIVKPSRLLYPSERRVRGSTTLFRAFWQRCLARGVFAVCVLTQVRKTAPRYVALVPQTEASGGADAMRIVYLPMQTDIRELNVFAQDREPVAATTEAVQLMRKVVQNLTFAYNERTFGDPYLYDIYANLEALAFDEAKYELPDYTVPDHDVQDQRLNGIFGDGGVEEIFGSDNVTARPVKRKIYGSDDEPTAKEQRTRTRELGREDIISAILSGVTGKLTVAQLRDFAQTVGVVGVRTMKKADLIVTLQQIL